MKPLPPRSFRQRRRTLYGLLALATPGALPPTASAANAAPNGHINYPEVRTGFPLVFPRDHGAHPDFRTEWWYITGHVNTRSGARLGFQITFFRNRPDLDPANPSAFAPRQLIIGHAALADPARGHLLHDQRIARAGFGVATAAEGDAHLTLDRWQLRRNPATDVWQAHIPGDRPGFDLLMTPTQDRLLQGSAGYSQKGPLAHQASYYYSLPQLRVAGTVRAGGQALPVEGKAWMDHEWSSALLDPRAIGWDWTGLNFSDGSALMAFVIRRADGSVLWSGGLWRDASGAQQIPPAGSIRFEVLRTWRSPRTGTLWPVEQRLVFAGRRWRLTPLFDDQELDARATTQTVYWEGAVVARPEAGQGSAPALQGQGYLELTGYHRALKL